MSQLFWLEVKNMWYKQHIDCAEVEKLMMLLLLMLMMVMTIRNILMVPSEEGRLASRCSNRRGFPVWPVASKSDHLWHCGIGNYGDDLHWWLLPKQCHCRWYPNCSWGAVLFQKPRELAWKKSYLSVFTWSRKTKVWESDSPKLISDSGPIMKADDKTEILLSHIDLAQGIKETVRSCHSPVVTDLENRLVIYFQRNEPKMMKADPENAVIMHEKIAAFYQWSVEKIWQFV